MDLYFFPACGPFPSDFLPEFSLYQWLLKGNFFPSTLRCFPLELSLEKLVCSAVCLRRLCLKMHITAGAAEPSIVHCLPGATLYSCLLWILCGPESETASEGMAVFCFRT